MFKRIKVKLDKNTQAFFALVKAGLWENFPVHGEGLMVIGSSDEDWEKVYQLAEEQSVVGLVLAGIEHSYVKPPQDLLLQWIGEVQIIEQQNKAMNEFVASLIEKLRKNGIYAILVKGQGIAQCYEKPLWRASGDVDLLLSSGNYEKAKKMLIPLSDSVENEFSGFKHTGMAFGEWIVELHGTLHSRLSKRVDKGIDEAQNEVFYGGNVRSWVNGNTQVFLPRADEDVIFVFTHILHHFFIDGIGLRQICDWCRLLYTYKESLNYGLLESRIKAMGLMSEWKAFASLGVEYLGMPVEAMPFYDSRFKAKCEQLVKLILESGNFGHNRKWTRSDIYVVRKYNAFWRKFKNFCRKAKVFPLDSFKFFFHFVGDGMYAAVRGE